MRRSSDGLYNGLTIFFVALTIIICMGVVLLLTKVVPVPVAIAPSSPTLIATKFIPSETPTPTNTLTPLPSETSQPTSTPVPSKTPSPIPDTVTPTPIPDTPLPPTSTPLPTKAPPPTRTPTFTKTPKPTIDPSLPTKTPRGFPFKVAGNTLTANLNTAIGCSFEGIGGQVLGLNNEAVPNITIVVTSASGFNRSAMSGSNSRYGQSGWEVQVDVQPNNQTYNVELRSDKGVPLSAKIPVNFPGACDQNLALINFSQTRPF